MTRDARWPFRTARGPILAVAAACAAGVFATGAEAQDGGPSVEVEVSQRTLSVDESLRVTVRVSGQGADGARIDARPPEGVRLLPLGSWSSSTQVSWINGRFSATKEFSTEYVPSGLGAGKVPSFAVVLGERTVRTDPVAVKIVESPGGGAAGAASPDAARGGPEGARGTGDEVEIVPRVSRRRLYAGESLTIEYVLRTRVSVSGIDPEALDPVAGFLVEDLDVHPRSTEKEVTDASGRTWREYVLFRRKLTPTRTGSIEVPPVPFRVEIPTRRDDLLRFAFRSGSRRLTRVARRVTVEVKPLPDDGRPGAFSGAVGTFEMDARLGAGTAAAGEAVELQVSVSGSGPLDAVSPPEVVAPGDVQVFTPRERTEGGRTTWIYPIVPRAAGTVRIESVRFAYFDTQEESFRELTAGPFTLEVSPAAAAGEAALGATPRAGPVRAQARDLHFVHPAPRRLASREGARNGLLLAALAGAPLVLLPLAVAAGRFTSRYARSAAGRRRRVEARVRAAYRDAEKLAGQDADAALRSLLAGLHAWCDTVVCQPSRPLERSRLRRLIAERTGDASLADRAVAVLDRAEAARYAGRSSAEEVRGLVGDARRLADAS